MVNMADKPAAVQMSEVKEALFSTLPQRHSFHTSNIHPYPTHFWIFYHSVWKMCLSTTISVPAGKALRILLVNIAFS